MKMYCTFISAMEIYLLYCKTVLTEKKKPYENIQTYSKTSSTVKSCLQ